MLNVFRTKASFKKVVPKQCAGPPWDLHDCMDMFPVAAGMEL